MRYFAFLFFLIGLIFSSSCKKIKAIRDNKYTGDIFCTYYFTGKGYTKVKVESFFTSASYNIPKDITTFNLSGMNNTNWDLSPPDFEMKINGKATGGHPFSINNSLNISFNDKRNGRDTNIVLTSMILDNKNLVAYQSAGNIEINTYGIITDAVTGNFSGEVVEGYYDNIAKKAVVVRKYAVNGEFAVTRQNDTF